MNHFIKIGALATGLLAAVGCDYSGDFLFPEPPEEVEAIVDIGELPVVEINSAQDAADMAVYGQVAASGDARESGVTYTFQGTGSNVCVWVDPEFVTWNQSVASRGRVARWGYPDNLKDDGDLDLEVGLSIYYNGSPGEEIGDFAIRYDDALGNPVEIELNECVIPSAISASNGHTGRGAVEYCTIFNTQPGVSYTVKMSAWSVPLNDDRLGYGVLLADGTCTNLRETLGVGSDTAAMECVVPGEAIDYIEADGQGPWTGADNIFSVAGSRDHEQAYCDGERMDELCELEATEKDCTVDQCFCGDPTDTPSGGAF